MPLILVVRVIPRSKKPGCAYDTSGRLTIRVCAAPEHGAANQELCAYLSTQLSIPKSYISLLAGTTSRVKRVAIDAEMTQADLCRKLGLEEMLQTTIVNKREFDN